MLTNSEGIRCTHTRRTISTNMTERIRLFLYISEKPYPDFLVCKENFAFVFIMHFTWIWIQPLWLTEENGFYIWYFFEKKLKQWILFIICKINMHGFNILAVKRDLILTDLS